MGCGSNLGFGIEYSYRKKFRAPGQSFRTRIKSYGIFANMACWSLLLGTNARNRKQVRDGNHVYAYERRANKLRLLGVAHDVPTGSIYLQSGDNYQGVVPRIIDVISNVVDRDIHGGLQLAVETAPCS